MVNSEGCLKTDGDKLCKAFITALRRSSIQEMVAAVMINGPTYSLHLAIKACNYLSTTLCQAFLSTEEKGRCLHFVICPFASN